MDWPVTKAIATVVAAADGNASVYFSTGGGIIGGGQSNESIRNAALHAVSTATEFRHQMTFTTDFPLPSSGTVNFYALTDAGVFTASAPVAELQNQSHLLSKLGNAMQDIITQYHANNPPAQHP